MQLDSNFTKITATEQRVDNEQYSGTTSHTVNWMAELDGISMDGHHIQMERYGNTPTLAIRALFDAMHAADVTL